MKPQPKTKSKKAITAGCLFAGIGGFCAGLKSAGVKVVWANEKDEYANQTYKKNHRTNLLEKDVQELSVSGDKLEPVDILTAGFPCQSFSVAGDRKGFDDDRGKLFFQIVRIIEEFGDKKPSVLLLENVPNLLYGNQGIWFDEVMRTIRRAGYWFSPHNCKVLNTAEITSLPQRRDRLFMVATAVNAFDCNDFQFPLPNGDKVLPLGQVVDKSTKKEADNYLPTDNRYCKLIGAEIANGKKSSIYQLRRSYVREYKSECPTLTANMGVGGHNVPFVKDRWGVRRLTVAECAKLQGLDDIEFPEIPEKEMYKQIGNAVTLPVAKKLARECVRVIRNSSRG